MSEATRFKRLGTCALEYKHPSGETFTFYRDSRASTPHGPWRVQLNTYFWSGTPEQAEKEAELLNHLAAVCREIDERHADT